MQDLKVSDLQFLVYARKSQDDEDRQIASIPAQIQDLAEIANREKLTVIDKPLTEEQSAFHPGRPVFSSLAKRIENGEANAILAWSANRLARNSRDAGELIYMMDTGKLKAIKTKGRTYFNTSEDKFSLNIDFTVAKKSSDDLSAAVHRGNKYKFFEDKIWGSTAKPGFMNVTDPITKKRYVTEDPERYSIFQASLKSVFDGSLTPMEALSRLNNEWGYRTRVTKKQGGRPMSSSAFYKYLSDPYYYGIMERKIEGVVQQCEHSNKPMLTKEEFDVIQIRLGKKSRAKQGKFDFPYKVLRCGECAGSVTAEQKWQLICSVCKTKFHKSEKVLKCPGCHTAIEKMKGAKLLHYVYYRCTKKVHKNCTQGCIEVKSLEKQIDDELSRFEIDPDFRDWAIKYLNELNEQKVVVNTSAVDSLKKAHENIEKRLANLMRIAISPENVDGAIMSLTEVGEQKRVLVAEKEQLLEQLKKADKVQNDWYALSLKTFDFACHARHWFKSGDAKTKTQILSSLGSNLTLKDKKLRFEGHKFFRLIEDTKKDLAEIEKRLEPGKSVDSPASFYSLPEVNQRMLRD